MASPGPTPPVLLRSCRRLALPGAALLVVTLTVPAARSEPARRHEPRSHATVAGRHPDRLPAPPVTPAPTAAPAVRVTALPRARSVPAAPKARSVPAVQPVAPARPTRFRFDGPGFSVTSRVCAMPNAMVLDPPGDPRKQVCWVEAPMGVAPGSRTDTTYILGHSFARDPKTVLGRLSRLASAQIARGRTVYRSGVPTRTITALAGSTLTLWTRHGVLTYRVGTTFAVPKPQFGLVRRIEDDTLPRRVVLVTCAVHGGRDLDYNVIVEARLVSARPAG